MNGLVVLRVRQLGGGDIIQRWKESIQNHVLQIGDQSRASHPITMTQQCPWIVQRIWWQTDKNMDSFTQRRTS